MSTVTWPEGNVLLRNLGKPLPVVSHGQGVWLFDHDGRRWLDGSAGAFVASVGHGNRAIAEAMAAQLSRVAYVNGTHFTSDATEELAARLAARMPGEHRWRAAFLSSGSEVVEAAIKFARQLWYERKELGRTRIVARLPSYHGNTLYALSASGRPHYKTVYGPLLSEVVTVSSPYPYRTPVDDYAAQGADYLVAEFEAALERVGPETVAAFIAEPVIGSSAGAAVPPPGYFEKMGAVCRRHGILMIADEVLVGAGRTGSFYAIEQQGFEPDILVMGKGISGGYAPLSCLLVREDHVAEMKAGSGGFMHAQTYMQAPCMTAAGVAVLDYFDRHDVLGNATRQGARLQQGLQGLLELPFVGSVQGIGMLAGVELVADKATKRPFERKLKVTERLLTHLFDRGLVLWSNVGHADGVNGDLLMISPPLIASSGEVDHLLASLRDGLASFAWPKV